MSMLLTIVANFVSIILFLFFYWKNLKEDHSSQEIFSSGFLLIGAILVGGMAGFAISSHIGSTRIFSPSGLWFWGGAIGLAIGFFSSLKRYNFRPFEMIETLCVSVLAWLLILSISETLWVISGLLLSLILLFLYLRGNYRKFHWYKSGKVGLAGLSTFALFFLLRSILAIFFYEPMLFFGRAKGVSLLIGRIDAIVSATLAFLFIVSIYNLSKSK